MARIEIDPNYSSPTFSRATAAADIFKKEDVQALAAALSAHDHSTGKGLVVSGIAPNSITGAMIQNGTITGADIAASTITGANIAPNVITFGHIAPDTIVAENIAPGAIGTSELGDGSVSTAKIVDRNVTGAKIALATILAENLAHGSVSQIVQAVYPATITTTSAAVVGTPDTATIINLQAGSTLLLLGYFPYQTNVNNAVATLGFVDNGGSGIYTAYVSSMMTGANRDTPVMWAMIPNVPAGAKSIGLVWAINAAATLSSGAAGTGMPRMVLMVELKA
jgi:hypothetical protein